MGRKGRLRRGLLLRVVKQKLVDLLLYFARVISRFLITHHLILGVFKLLFQRRLGLTLQRAVPRDAGNVYLHLEDAVNERASDEQDLLVRWAFRQGRRYERRRS